MLINPLATVVFDAGVVVFYVSYFAAGVGVVQVAAAGAPVSASINVSGPASQLVLGLDQNTTAAGQQRTLSITCEDADGFTVDPSEPVTVTSTDPGLISGGNPVALALESRIVTTSSWAESGELRRQQHMFAAEQVSTVSSSSITRRSSITGLSHRCLEWRW